MKAIKEKYIGVNIGVYTVLALCDYKTKDNHKVYKCRCNVCGYIRETRISDLNKEVRYRVGCHHYRKDGTLNRICDKKRWFRNPELSKRYSEILARCYNPEHRDYKWYGGRGIKVCEEWLDNPRAFEDFCLRTYNGQLCLNRINVEGDYCPENCQWETLEETARNKTTTNYYYDGEATLTGKQLSKKYNLGVNNFNKYFRENNIAEEEVTPEMIITRANNIKLKNARRETNVNNV